MKPSSLILSILLSLTVAMGLYIYFGEDTRKVYIYVFGVFLFLLTLVYILQAEIDWYWWQRKPPAMPAPLERQIALLLPFYQRLDPIEKKRFRDRTMLWVNGKEHIVKSLETFPEEVMNIIGAYGVMMTFGTEKYLLHPYERIVLYPHPFPTPEHQYLHNSESFDENGKDGVVIFNATHLMAGVNNPKQYYNLVLHEYASVYIKNYPKQDYPTFQEEEFPILEKIRGLALGTIKETIGLKEIDIQQVAIEHFFTVPYAFSQAFPERYQQLCQIFNLNPLIGNAPVIQIRAIGDNPLAGE